ncbi:hypothetical protein EGW08_004296 [Elysia chlorotica]|uniref:Beta-lactamase-related domain-containing protein n=1 Tax=Elysia chlorotica TaxID=188477 RepID=A0A433U287_ELYCH|nr:hypothetical protein EGW08_004296 [Elysia chlorotica]
MGFRQSAVLAALCIALFTVLTNGVDLTREQKDELDNIAREIEEHTNTPGFSLYILDREKAITHRYTQEGPTFCVGDGTRAFSAVLLGILIDNNENVTWDTPIEEILDTRTYLPDMYRTKNLNLRDIFSMRSGLSGMDIVPFAQPYDQEQLIKKLRYAPVVANFREKYIHNDVLFSLVDKVSEKLGGASWHDLMRQYIIDPLGMVDTFFAGDSDFVKSLRSGKSMTPMVQFRNDDHRLEMKVYDGLEMVASGTSLCTSATDMYRWFLFLSDGGAIADRATSRRIQIIKTETLEMLYQGILPRGLDGNPSTEGYRVPNINTSYTRTMNSMGFINGNYDGDEFVSQDGSLPGYQTLATYIPAKKTGVFVGILGDERPTNFAAKVLMNIAALDIMKGGKSWVTRNNVRPLIAHLVKLHTKPNTIRPGLSRQIPNERDLKDFVNTYENYAFGKVEVKYNATGKGELTLHYGTIDYDLKPTNQNDTFKMIVSSGPMWFSTNADWYHDTNNLYAVFAASHVRVDEDGNEVDHYEDEDDENVHFADWVMNVTIAGFDSQTDPVFARRSRNLRPPYYETERRHDMKCSAPRSLLSSPAIFVLWAGALLSCVAILFI